MDSFLEDFQKTFRRLAHGAPVLPHHPGLARADHLLVPSTFALQVFMQQALILHPSAILANEDEQDWMMAVEFVPLSPLSRPLRLFVPRLLMGNDPSALTSEMELLVITKGSCRQPIA